MTANDIRLRAWNKLIYRDPYPILEAFSALVRAPGFLDLPYPQKSLRTQSLKPYRELRQAAVFAHGMASYIGEKVYIAMTEAEDYDLVASFRKGKVINRVPVQLKELVPNYVNAKGSIQAQIDMLKTKYPDSRDLAVALHVNRRIELVVGDLDVNGLNLGELWFYGSDTADNSDWFLLGNFLAGPLKEVRFTIP